ncbi:unnamed protein product, partial [Hapterophycus canaliculatus]
ELPQPLRVFLTGTAGTGKTVIIKEMVRRLGRRRFMLLAATGNAACGIGGGERLSLNVASLRQKAGFEIGEAARTKLQRKVEGIDFVLVDEFSMIS